MAIKVFVCCVFLITLNVRTSEGHFERFTFLGKFNRTTDQIADDQIYYQSWYFLSQNAAGWSTAISDCKSHLGDTASILNIETEEEQDQVISFLQNSNEKTSTFWTGGMYDYSESQFVWNNGIELLQSAPWDQGHPSTRTTATRVLIHKNGRFVRFRTNLQTLSLRYICEITVELYNQN